MKYVSYQHVERLGTEETEGLLNGRCHVQPKIDGTNGTLFMDDSGRISAGSRKVQLNPDKDNRGFFRKFVNDSRFIGFLTAHPDLRLFGEYLTKHTVRTYLDDAWDEFYVFDVCRDTDERDRDGNMKLHYLTPSEYVPLLQEYSISYIPDLAEIDNPTMSWLTDLMESNTFLIQPGMGTGEGIVIKNYGFENIHGRTVWGKLVADEFRRRKRERSGRHRSDSLSDESCPIEEQIVRYYLTDFVVEKEYRKMIHNEDSFPGKEASGSVANPTGRLISILYRVLCVEDMWDMVRVFRNPTVDFRKIRTAIIGRIREVKPELFRKK